MSFRKLRLSYIIVLKRLNFFTNLFLTLIVLALGVTLGVVLVDRAKTDIVNIIITTFVLALFLIPVAYYLYRECSLSKQLVKVKRGWFKK